MRKNESLLDTTGADNSFGASSLANGKTSFPLLFDEFHEFFMDEVRSIFDNWLSSNHLLRDFANFSHPVGRWPKIDIEEDDDNYYVVVATPGFSKEEVSVEIVNTQSGCALNIVAEKQEEREDRRRHYSEIRYTKGKRVIPLTGSFRCDIDVDNISAEDNGNGTFTITLPKCRKQENVSNVKKINIE